MGLRNDMARRMVPMMMEATKLFATVRIKGEFSVSLMVLKR